MVSVNFVWGILVFHEPVHSVSGTCGTSFFLGLGLIGMTIFSSAKTLSTEKESMQVESTGDQDLVVGRDGLSSRLRADDDNEETIPIMIVSSQDETDDDQISKCR
jgi:hypothetical protein